MEHLVKGEEVKDWEGILINRLVGFQEELGGLRQLLVSYGHHQSF